MGIKAIDINPLRAGAHWTQTPPAKDVYVKAFQVPRTQTVAADEVVLPADATIIGIRFYSAAAASNAGTTAAITINVKNSPQNGVAPSTISTGSQNVLTAGNVTGLMNMSGLPNIENIPSATEVGDLRISAVYAETGTASTTGGPWNFVVEYVR